MAYATPYNDDRFEELEHSMNEIQSTLIDLMLLDKPDDSNKSVYSMPYDDYMSLNNKL
jgi:hypothetical protein